jgi:hypothetical protein
MTAPSPPRGSPYGVANAPSQTTSRPPRRIAFLGDRHVVECAGVETWFDLAGGVIQVGHEQES